MMSDGLRKRLVARARHVFEGARPDAGPEWDVEDACDFVLEQVTDDRDVAGKRWLTRDEETEWERWRIRGLSDEAETIVCDEVSKYF